MVNISRLRSALFHNKQREDKMNVPIELLKAVLKIQELLDDYNENEDGLVDAEKKMGEIPVIATMGCDNLYDIQYYGSDEFSVDEDGNEKGLRFEFTVFLDDDVLVLQNNADVFIDGSYVYTEEWFYTERL